MRKHSHIIFKVITSLLVATSLIWSIYISGIFGSDYRSREFEQLVSEFSYKHDSDSINAGAIEIAPKPQIEPQLSNDQLQHDDTEKQALLSEIEEQSRQLVLLHQQLSSLEGQLKDLRDNHTKASKQLQKYVTKDQQRAAIINSGITYRKSLGILDSLKELRAQRLDEEYKKVASLSAQATHQKTGKSLNTTKIVILSAYDDEWLEYGRENLTQMALDNREEYARFHGYIHQQMNLTELRLPEDPEGLDAVWLKARAINRAYEMNPKAEWVWWLDMDVIIMNPYLELTEHLLSEQALTKVLRYNVPLTDNEGKVNGLTYYSQSDLDVRDIDLVISEDMFGLNAGSFFIRKSAFSDWFLDMWYDPVFVSFNFIRAEQGCLIWLINNHECVRRHVGLVPQKLMNSYYDPKEISLPPGKWFEDGDLLIHFAGTKKKEVIFRLVWDRYWSERRLLPEDNRIAPVNSTNVYNVSLSEMDIPWLIPNLADVLAGKKPLI